MSYQKIANLVQRICEKSKYNLIEWEGTEKEGTYQVSFSNYSIRIFSTQSKNNPSDIAYVMQIINSDGELVEETDDEDLKQWWDDSYIEMKLAHETARRKVMGVEDALDSILHELDDDIPDDHMPF